MKKIISLTLSLLIALCFTGCSGAGDKDTQLKNEDFFSREILTESISDDVYFEDGDLIIKGNSQSIRLKKSRGGYGMQVEEQGKILAVNDTPIRLSIAIKGELSIDIKSYDLAFSYGNLYKSSKYGFTASKSVTTTNGSKLVVDDNFSFVGESINVERQIKVVSSAQGDLGFASTVLLRSNIATEGVGKYDTCEYFIPGIFYRDNQNMVMSAIGASKHTKSFAAKETRTGLPMVMLRDKSNGATISIAHFSPEISTPSEKRYPEVAVGDEFKCGSVGVARDPSPSIYFTYPYHETQGYVVNLGKTHRFFEMRNNNNSSFTVSIYGSVTEDYNQAMVESYKEHFVNTDKNPVNVNLNALYDQSIKDLAALYKTDDSGACGFPFAAFVDNGEIFDYSYEIGFIGMQASLAAQMIRYGLKNTDHDVYGKGLSIINFWSTQGAMPSGTLRVWAFSSGGFRYSPSYLRMMTDGAEGLLDAYRLLKAEGKTDGELSSLKNAIWNYANFLVDKQNEDGSYYRAYDLGGNMFTSNNEYGQKEDPTTKADSKLNTPIAIRFLLRMYEQTGELKYLNAAKKAGDFVIENICEKGKYVGGTPDNANTCDREAAIYGLYAFNALYSVTGEAKYLKCAEEAAINALSWMYTFNFTVENGTDLIAGKAYEMGMIDGLSLIATGHSAVDTFISCTYYDLFKLYVWTGNGFYYDAAVFVQNNSRQTVSMVSDLDFAFDSFAIEATDVSNGFFITAETRGVWLPWITNCNIEPIANMRQTFGTSSVEDLKEHDLEALRQKLASYGAGGKAYGYVI